MNSRLFSTAVFILLSWSVNAETYYVDASNGSDTNNGSLGSPWKSWNKAWSSANSGDNIKLHPGNYGSINEYNNPKEFSSLVTVSAVTPNTASFDNVTFTNKPDLGAMNVKFENINFNDGLTVWGVKGFQVYGALIRRFGPWTGSVPNIEKTAVLVKDSFDVTIANSEVTETGHGIVVGSSTEVLISNNHIHDITHDGLRAVGAQNTTFEYNRVHGLNDGITDDSGLDWNRHCDGLHIFISGGNKLPNDGLLFNGNVFYDVEGQLVQFNNLGGTVPADWNKNISFVNNVFGPSSAPMSFNNADPAYNLTLYNNVFINKKSVYTSPWDEIQNKEVVSESSGLRISPLSQGVSIFNNILWAPLKGRDEYDFYDFNVVQTLLDEKIPLPRNTKYVKPEDLGLLDYNNFDVRLKNNSPLIDQGINLSFLQDLGVANGITHQVNTDVTGETRDYRFDIGAHEIAGRTPIALAIPSPDIKRHLYADDFEDGNLFTDILPKITDATSLNWKALEGSVNVYLVERNTDLSSVNNEFNLLGGAMGNEGKTWLVSDTNFANGKKIDNFDLSLTVANDGVRSDSGPAILVTDQNNFVYIDMGKDTGIVKQVKDGVEYNLSEPTIQLQTPNKSYTDISIKVRLIPQLLEDSGLSVYELTLFSENEDIPTKIFAEPIIIKSKPGTIGFYHNAITKYFRLFYDNLIIQEFLPNTPPVIN